MSDASTEEKERKPYVPPQIVHEIELETQAGSVIIPPTLNDGLPDLLDLDR